VGKALGSSMGDLNGRGRVSSGTSTIKLKGGPSQKKKEPVAVKKGTLCYKRARVMTLPKIPGKLLQKWGRNPTPERWGEIAESKENKGIIVFHNKTKPGDQKGLDRKLPGLEACANSKREKKWYAKSTRLEKKRLSGPGKLIWEAREHGNGYER